MTHSVSLPHVLLLILLAFSSATYSESNCAQNNVKLQVLGSGGPELGDKRASSGYLIWINGKASVLIDAGAGSSLNFEKSSAKFEDLQAIVFSHFHVDHSVDFPTYIKGSFFTSRQNDLPVFGPEGNALMPSTTEFVNKTLGDDGAFSYLQNFVNTEQPSSYHIQSHNVPLTPHKIQHYPLTDNLSLSAIPVHHGPLAAVAWRVNVFDCSITFTGDMNNQYKTLAKLAKNTDILVMHNAIAESAKGVAANLHMKPAEMGKIANKANAKSVVISHRMLRTLGHEAETKQFMEKNYRGPINFADDLDVFLIP
ncbi:MAG: MBL fold metallo-hydrolase [Methylophaga sp.]|nr:MBL fold metallo-hydrolase [Methylophaga sp.]